MSKKIFLYNPINNTKTCYSSYKEIHKITGDSVNNIVCAKTRGTKLRSVNCYVIDESATIHTLKLLCDKLKLNDEIWVKSSVAECYVSNYGRVKRINKDGTTNIAMQSGYHKNELYVKIHGKAYAVHFLVCSAFYGKKPSDKHIVIHKNGIITDNHALNVKWGTRKELRKIHKNGRCCPVAKVDIETDEIIYEYSSLKETALDNYSPKMVSQCVNNKRKEHGGFKWIKIQ